MLKHFHTSRGLLLEWLDHLQVATATPDVDTLPKGMLPLVYHVMFQTAHSPRRRRVVSAIGSSVHVLLPPNMTTILKFSPDPNTVAV